MEATTNRSGDITAVPSVDSVEEFKVSTSGYDAEFGRSAGGVVSIQTKSGTNKWHGSAYEFFRPNFTTAKAYGFDGDYVPPSIYKQHNYGGTFGGPIIKDKTFFFVSYEGLYNTNAYNYVYAVPPISQVKMNPDGSVDLTGLVDPDSGNQIPIYDPAVFSTCYGGCYPADFVQRRAQRDPSGPRQPGRSEHAAQLLSQTQSAPARTTAGTTILRFTPP